MPASRPNTVGTAPPPGTFNGSGGQFKTLTDLYFAQASSNLESVNLLPAMGANVYDIMRHDTLVLTRAAVEKLEARFNG